MKKDLKNISMDYEKKYKEALERAKSYQKLNKSAVITAIFPELAESKESKNEKIRKALISVLTSDFEKDTTINDITVEEIVDWLEKQGEQKPEVEYVYPKFRAGDLIEEIEPNGYSKPVRVRYIGYGYYACESDDHKRFLSLPIKQEDDFRLVEEKEESELDEVSYLVGLKRIIDNPKSYGLVKIDKDTQEWIESIIKDYEELAQTDKEHLEIIKAKINTLKSIIL